ncbi:MarC family protein [Noviherbaspirillum aridicola]|uniref:UPF0056 membrane protein n=1 Tax=Noviherbaspirillum aridicola TaxID=2849687 RepID=A0ABQ4PZ18_9BURK|nr:MarC family protein [Noviherbaspirillum aridicola]GIZ50145.1 UPF0056 inner membrane protein [Noviherbaspirillum aridicola]
MDMFFLKAALLVPLTLLPILNPLGNATVFASAAAGAGPELESRLARQVALNCLFLLLGAMLIGSQVLAFFGVTLPAVRLGGGLMVAAAGWCFLNEAAAGTGAQAGNAWSESLVKTRSFYPISFPLTAGPGSLAAAITLGATEPGDLYDRAASVAGSILGLAVTVAVIYLFYRHASRIVGLLGEAGTVVVRRLFAFILLCAGIQVAWNAALDLLAASGLRLS